MRAVAIGALLMLVACQTSSGPAYGTIVFYEITGTSQALRVGLDTAVDTTATGTGQMMVVSALGTNGFVNVPSGVHRLAIYQYINSTVSNLQIRVPGSGITLGFSGAMPCGNTAAPCP